MKKANNVPAEAEFAIDACFLITLKNYYYMDVFESLWENLYSTFQNNKIVLLEEIKDEILSGEDDLSNWIKNNITNCYQLSNDDINLSRYLINKYPKNVKLTKPNENDPFLIAFAKNNNLIVLTCEKRKDIKNDEYIKTIPNICDKETVNCVNSIRDFLTQMNWKF